MMMSIVVWAQDVVFTRVISNDVDDWDRWFLGRAPRTRETLPDFRESCRVARHSRVFRGLTGSQWTLRFWGVIITLQGSVFIWLFMWMTSSLQVVIRMVFRN